jgi:hypothetical protein
MAVNLVSYETLPLSFEGITNVNDHSAGVAGVEPSSETHHRPARRARPQGKDLLK